MSGPFIAHARELIINGYSPMPIRPGKKAPILNEWETLREAPVTEKQLEEIGKQYPMAGLGVTGGYNGLVPIDVDTDDKKIKIFMICLYKKLINLRLFDGNRYYSYEEILEMNNVT